VWGSLDVAGGYWVSDDPVALPDGEYEGIAVLTEQGSPSNEGTVVVDSGDHGPVTFAGPVYCMWRRSAVLHPSLRCR
jgi:hypothetical protein